MYSCPITQRIPTWLLRNVLASAKAIYSRVSGLNPGRSSRFLDKFSLIKVCIRNHSHQTYLSYSFKNTTGVTVKKLYVQISYRPRPKLLYLLIFPEMCLNKITIRAWVIKKWNKKKLDIQYLIGGLIYLGHQNRPRFVRLITYRNNLFPTGKKTLWNWCGAWKKRQWLTHRKVREFLSH